MNGTRSSNPWAPNPRGSIPLAPTSRASAPWDNARFSFVPDLERHWREIRLEMRGLDPDHFFPWYETEAYNHGWLVCGLIARSFPDEHVKFEEIRKRCPQTMEVMARIPGLMTAAFSLLQPGTIIYPHEEPDMETFRVHLPLVVPGDCELRLGETSHHWSEGQCLIFDNRKLHGACNLSKTERVVLLIDVLRSTHSA